MPQFNKNNIYTSSGSVLSSPYLKMLSRCNSVNACAFKYRDRRLSANTKCNITREITIQYEMPLHSTAELITSKFFIQWGLTKPAKDQTSHIKVQDGQQKAKHPKWLLKKTVNQCHLSTFWTFDVAILATLDQIRFMWRM